MEKQNQFVNNKILAILFLLLFFYDKYQLRSLLRIFLS